MAVVSLGCLLYRAPVSQSLLFVPLHILGVLVCLAIGPRNRIPLCAALGFPVGLAVYVLSTLTLLALGVPYRLFSIAPLCAAIMLVCALSLVRAGGLSLRSYKIIGAWTAVFALLSVVVCSINIAILSYDSHILVMWGVVIGEDGQLVTKTMQELSSWGVFQPLAHSAAQFLPQEYLYSLSPHLGLSFVAVFALCFAHGLKALGLEQTPLRAVALVTAALVTIFFFQRHFIYIHNNLSTSVYLFYFVSLFWIAETDKDTQLLPIAFLCLSVCAIQRVETPLFALLFAVLAVFPSRLPRLALAKGLIGFTLVAVGWYLLLAKYAPKAGIFLTASRCWLVIGLFVFVCILWLVTRGTRLASLNRRVPDIALGLCALGLVLAVALKPMHMLVSAKNWMLNLIVSDYWGLAAPIVVILLLLSTRLPRPPNPKLLSIGILTGFGLIILLAFGRTPYRAIHVGDSANRMTLHLVPLLFFYLGLRFVPVLGDSSERSID